MAEHDMKLTDVALRQEHNVPDHASLTSWEGRWSVQRWKEEGFGGRRAEDTNELGHLKTTDADLMGLVLPKHFFSSKNLEKE